MSIHIDLLVLKTLKKVYNVSTHISSNTQTPNKTLEHNLKILLQNVQWVILPVEYVTQVKYTCIYYMKCMEYESHLLCVNKQSMMTGQAVK